MPRLAASRWPGLCLMLAGLAWAVGLGADVWALSFFAVGSAWVIAGLWLENRRLEAGLAPRLSLVFRPVGGPTDLYDSYHFLRNGEVWRYVRVGVVNSGRGVSVAVKLAALSPDQYPIFPMQEFAQTHTDAASRFIVERSAGGPTTFVDVIAQKVEGQHGPTTDMRLVFAAGPAPLSCAVERYRLALAIEGPGAGAPQRYELSRNADGQYDVIELG